MSRRAPRCVCRVHWVHCHCKKGVWSTTDSSCLSIYYLVLIQGWTSEGSHRSSTCEAEVVSKHNFFLGHISLSRGSVLWLRRVSKGRSAKRAMQIGEGSGCLRCLKSCVGLGSEPNLWGKPQQPPQNLALDLGMQLLHRSVTWNRCTPNLVCRIRLWPGNANHEGGHKVHLVLSRFQVRALARQWKEYE